MTLQSTSSLSIWPGISPLDLSAPFGSFRYTPCELVSVFDKAGFVPAVTELKSRSSARSLPKFNYCSLRLVGSLRVLRWGLLAVDAVFWYLDLVDALHSNKFHKVGTAEAKEHSMSTRKSCP